MSEWTDEEDAKLYHHVVVEELSFGDTSDLMPGRTRGACQGRFKREFPGVKRKSEERRFTPAEDKYLIDNYEPGVFSFNDCAVVLGRSMDGCQKRYRVLQEKRDAEDERIRQKEIRTQSLTGFDDGGNPNRCSVMLSDPDRGRVRCKWPAQRTVGKGNLCAGCHSRLNVTPAEVAA